MKFSVVVPVYNAELYLNRLVKSVLDQTFSDFELILVDDGSTDNSFALMKKLQEKDSRIKIFSKENTGPGYTRKYGFEKSSGELLFFVDSDDWITTSDVLREINDLFEKNENIEVVIRPEDIKMVEPNEGMLKGIVTSTVFKGVHYEILVETSERTYMVQTTDFSEVGSKVGLAFGPEDIHVMYRMGSY